MSSRAPGNRSAGWADSARDIAAEWSLGGGEAEAESPDESLSPAGNRKLGAESRPWQVWRIPDEIGPDDSIPGGSTVIHRTKAPRDAVEPPGSDEAATARPVIGPPAALSNVPEDEGLETERSRRLPRIGDQIGGFRLVLELGRGAFARVFLAEEFSLGHRLVALKVSQADGDEPQILARLQHTHIVPVHSVHDDQDSGLRLLCMPFFGGANLAQILQVAWGHAQPNAPGRSLVAALDEFSQRLPPSLVPEPSLGFSRARRPRARSHSVGPANFLRGLAALPVPVNRVSPTTEPAPSIRSFRSLVTRLVRIRDPHPAAAEFDADVGPSRRFLQGADGTHAAVWIVARLAEGLDHAHSNGLLHRDLKPANILIAADGTPMLLDFNLAAEVEPCQQGGEGASRAVLGGTLPYMSPEHLDALDPHGSTAPESVDERSDLYALGLILFEMIAGEHPFPEIGPDPGRDVIETLRLMIDDRRRRPQPSLRARCSEVPWSLEALVAQCLDPDPDRRYQSAHDLAEDLRRFLDDQPMKYCPEPSLKERAGKWARRHPALSSSTSIAIVSVILMSVLAGAAAYAYDGMLGLAARMKLQAFDRDAMDAQFQLNVAGRDDELMRRGTEQTRKILDRMGIAEPALASGARSARTAAAGPSFPSWMSRLAAGEAAKIRRQLVELLVLEARAGVLLADRQGTEDVRRTARARAVARLDQAEGLDAAIPSVLYSERARYHAALRNAKQAARDRERARKAEPTTAQDLTMLGASLLSTRDLTGAENALRRAIALDVTSIWAWFTLGHCHFEQGRYLEAAGDFSACVARGPHHSWCHFNRGLALARAGRPLDALIAYDQAIQLDPDLVEGRVNRALVKLELDRAEDALRDLQAAIEAGRREPAILAALGETLSRLGRHGQAEATFSELLRRSPDDPVILAARGMSRLAADPAQALEDFNAVLARHPRDAMAHYGAARVIRASDRRQAIAHLDAALDADPHLIDALQLRALERARLGERSALDDVDLLIRTPTARRLYNAACALALHGEAAHDSISLDRAIQVLAQALKAGFQASQAAGDPDLRSLHNRAEFAHLIHRFTPPTSTPRGEPAA